MNSSKGSTVLDESISAVKKTRKQLNSYTFDVSTYLGTEVSTVNTDAVDSEKKLFSLFEQLTKSYLLMSKEIEIDVSVLQDKAIHTETILLKELGTNAEKLVEVGNTVDNVKLSFDLASEGAVRIGGKLSSAERERSHIDKSTELLGYIKVFQDTPESHYTEGKTAQRLRQSLPPGLQKQNWGAISGVLYDLKMILFELNADDIKNAQKNIGKVADKVEIELLAEFDKIIIKLIDNQDEPRFIDRARELAEWLHLFNNGQSIQKRYIFSVVQHRIPNDSFFQSFNNTNASNNNALTAAVLTGGGVNRNENGHHHHKNGKKAETSSLVSPAATLAPPPSTSSSGSSWFRSSGQAATSPVVSNAAITTKSDENDFDDDDEDDDEDTEDDTDEDDDDDDHDEDDDCNGILRVSVTANGALQYPMGLNSPSYNNNNWTNNSNTTSSGLSLIDQLSGLFSVINTVCQEQFSIIRNVFPVHTVARVTRMLIQRIFNDPAFGIQARVDAILCPAPPQPPLSLPEYLDALVIVREKLSALHLLLLECCSHPSMRGMGSESASLKKAKYPVNHYRHSNHNNNISNSTSTNNGNRNGVGYQQNNKGYNSSDYSNNGYNSNNNNINNINDDIEEEDEVEEIMQSDAEIREFFDDQISQVFWTYLTDYFEKENTHIRNQLRELLQSAVEDPTNSLTKPIAAGNNSSSAVLVSLSLLRSDRIKSILHIVQTVGNKVFLNRIFAIITDAANRMESIGRDDKKLPLRLKELFLLQLHFLSDALFLPWSKGCNAMLLKQLITRANVSTLPPTELLAAVSALTYGITRIRSHFDEVFARPLSVVPNIIAVCKENRLAVFRELETSIREALCAWALCIVAHAEKTLVTLQSKYDYAPKFEPVQMITSSRSSSSSSHGSNSTAATTAPTAACDTVCKSLLTVITSVRLYEAKLIGLDLPKLLWKPLGQQLVGIIISHIRKQKISVEGTKMLLRDIKEYSKIITMMDSPEITDMMNCLKELCIIFCAPAANLTKMVAEDMRYLDTAVVLSFVKARADFAVSKDPNHFSNKLSQLFSSYKWDSSFPLAWESSKQRLSITTPAALTECAAQGSKWANALGPSTLRRGSAASSPTTPSMDNNSSSSSGIAAAPVSALFISEVGRASVYTPASQLTANGRTVCVDVSRLVGEEGSEDIIPMGALRPSSSSSSQFLPNRPDAATARLSAAALHNNNNNGSTVSSRPVVHSTIARPFIIADTSAGNHSKIRNGAVTKGSAAALLLSQQQQQQQQNGSSNKNSNGQRTHQYDDTDFDAEELRDTFDSTSAAKAAPASKKLFNKVSNFFQGK